MAQKVRIELNQAAIRQQLLKSPATEAMCKKYAEEIAARCGDGYETKTYKTPTRMAAKVYADTFQARTDNLKNNTILKAVRS